MNFDRKRQFVVIALGVTNAGKSATLSALAGRRGLFRSGDVPRVTRSLQAEPSGCLLLVDTPGLDAAAEDSTMAIGAAVAADVVLFCHSLRVGEFRPLEIDALRAYAKRGGCIERTCFVMTHADDVADTETLQLVTTAAAAQLRTELQFPIVGWRGQNVEMPNGRRPRPFNLVGNERFWRAQTTAEPVRSSWLARSGIPRLRRYLDDLSARHGVRRESA